MVPALRLLRICARVSSTHITGQRACRRLTTSLLADTAASTPLTVEAMQILHALSVGYCDRPAFGLGFWEYAAQALPTSGIIDLNIIIPCYNEEANVFPISAAIESSLQGQKFFGTRFGAELDYKLVFVDNCSRDATWEKIQELSAVNPRVNGIRNASNYGQLLSPFKALCQSEASMTVLICADFEDPPTLIPSLIQAHLDTAADVVMAVREEDAESAWRRFARQIGYRLMKRVADTKSINGFHGFGLYSSRAINAFKDYRDIRPYIRLLPGYLGLSTHCIGFRRGARTHGSSSNNFVTLFDLAVDGLIQFSSFPVKLITFVAVLQWFVTLFLSVAIFVYYCFAGLSPLLAVAILTHLCASFLVLAIAISLQYLYRVYSMMSGHPFYSVACTSGDLKGLSLLA